MQYDLSDTLRKSGRLNTMDSINARIIKYHEDHPFETLDFGKLREQSVALNQQEHLLLTEDKLTEAFKSFRYSLASSEIAYQQNSSNAPLAGESVNGL